MYLVLFVSSGCASLVITKKAIGWVTGGDSWIGGEEKSTAPPGRGWVESAFVAGFISA
ncbi:MAG: hypothetical protein IPI28_15200 [Candidatus Omnitrophica bacterium]|nr:hypothetical protein [Candidatus Omnitrophota bacterium]